MPVVINGTTGITTPTESVATTIGVGGATPAASGAGITFPATVSASSDANTLDDYEEGTWTPGVGGTATYTTSVGTYRKIGGLVYASYYMIVNTVGTGNGFGITNLPFASASRTQPYMGHAGNFNNLVNAVAFLYTYNDAGTTSLNHGGTATVPTANAAVPIVVVGNGTALSGTIFYPAS